MTTRSAGRRERTEIVFFGIGRVLWLVLIVAVTGIPLLYMVILSVRSLQAVLANPLDFLPAIEELTLAPYRQVVTPAVEGGYGLLSFLGNSTYVAVGTVLITLTFSVLGAYAAARLQFFGKHVINTSFFAVYMFPGIVMAVPLFVLFSRLGLRGELPALMIIYLAQTVPVSVYMLRNYFASIPEGLEDAAKVDGCSRLQVVFRIVLPLSRPAIAATSLYVFIIAWNEYLFALLFLLERRDNWTVSLGLAQLDDISVSATVLMAGSVMLTLPVIVLFFLAQRILVEGLTAGAEKG